MRVLVAAKRTAGIAVALTALALVAAGCSNETSAADGKDAASAPGHIHNLALVDGEMFMGTHNGLWKQTQGGAVSRVSQDEWDVMGLTKIPEGWLAGGHPGSEQSGPTSLGLQKSSDGGQSWQPISLLGAVDFHRLAASGDVVVGLSSSGGALMISADRGLTWKSTTQVSLFDVTLDPKDPTVLVGTTQDGPVRSSDGGNSFAKISGAPMIALVSWSESTLYGVTPEGSIYASLDQGVTWEKRGTIQGAPVAISVDGENLAVLVGQAVVESTDGGRTFAPRLTGLGD